MYLCVCKAVSERTVRRAIHDDGVMTLRELSRLHGVGTGCGKCVPAARELLERERASPTTEPLPASIGLLAGVAAAA